MLLFLVVMVMMVMAMFVMIERAIDPRNLRDPGLAVADPHPPRRDHAIHAAAGAAGDHVVAVGDFAAVAVAAAAVAEAE